MAFIMAWHLLETRQGCTLLGFLGHYCKMCVQAGFPVYLISCYLKYYLKCGEALEEKAYSFLLFDLSQW